MNDLELIKEHYGDKMMELCKKLFPTILGTEGLLYSILNSKFAHSKFLYDDIVKNNKVDEFRDYILFYSSTKEPREMFKEFGYKFLRFGNEEEVEELKKYDDRNIFDTIFDKIKTESAYYQRWFVVTKENIREIADYSELEKENEYAKSMFVICIETITDLSDMMTYTSRTDAYIINRQGRRFDDLEMIMPGLTNAFNKNLYVNIECGKNYDFNLPNYVKAADGKYYGYNYHIGDTYYCSNNIIIDRYGIKEYPKDRYLIFDHFTLDLQNKNISKCGDTYDSFVESIGNISDIEIIDLEDGYKRVKINSNIEIILNERNQLISYKNKDVKKINSFFLPINTTLKCLSVPNAEDFGMCTLQSNKVLEVLDAPNVKVINSASFYENEAMSELCLESVERIGINVFRKNKRLKKFYAPNVRKIGKGFLKENTELQGVYSPAEGLSDDNFSCGNDLNGEKTFKK